MKILVTSLAGFIFVFALGIKTLAQGVEKRVRGTYRDKNGKENSDHSIFAWLEIWEKIEGKWKITTIASTAKYGEK